jgi:RsiW-degrading membrane proteinase PrsW (M82 family)
MRNIRTVKIDRILVMTALFLIATTLMWFAILSMATLGVNFYDSHSRWHTSEPILCAIACFLKGCIIALFSHL